MRAMLLLWTLGLAPVAHAVDVDPFDPSASVPHDSGTPAVESPALTGGGLSAGLLANAAEDLVTRTNADGELVRTVPHALSSTLYGGWTFEDKSGDVNMALVKETDTKTFRIEWQLS